MRLEAHRALERAGPLGADGGAQQFWRRSSSSVTSG